MFCVEDCARLVAVPIYCTGPFVLQLSPHHLYVGVAVRLVAASVFKTAGAGLCFARWVRFPSTPANWSAGHNVCVVIFFVCLKHRINRLSLFSARSRYLHDRAKCGAYCH